MLPRSHGLRVIYAAMTRHRRLQLYATVGLMLVGAIAEVCTISAVMPLLVLISNPDVLAKWPRVAAFLAAMGGGAHPAVPAAVLLAVAAVGLTVIRLALSWITNRFVFGLQYDIVTHIYGRLIRQPYESFITSNSSDALSALEKVHLVITGALSPALVGITSAWLALGIVAFLFFLDPVAMAVAIGTVGIVYLAMTLVSRRTFVNVSEKLAETRTHRVKIMQESLGGFRDIVLDHSQQVFDERLRGPERELRRLLVTTNLIALAPRFVIEGAAIVLIAVVAAYLSTTQGGALAALPTMGALALGAQRLLPLFQAMFLGWTSYQMYAHALVDVATLMETPVADTVGTAADRVPLPFSNRIEFRGVGYSYVTDQVALADIDLTIAKGDRIGLIGKSGSGKSTLADLVMGLLRPGPGAIVIDDVALDRRTIANWQRQIAHVPQAIFVTDDTITANIAFGSADDVIDFARVRDAAEQARALEFIDRLPQGFDTRVGERGIRLSGGQRQRIGIARALYRRASVLILDEATSALDAQTEAEVIESLGRGDRRLTLVMIAHRHSTLAMCDVIHRLSEGRVVQSGPPAAMLGDIGVIADLRDADRPG